jgi:phosphoribosylaminoimidazole-succinocarboxamide synthase
LEKQELLYEGKGKKLFLCSDKNLLVAEFKDDLTAFNAAKKSNEDGKGELNNLISTKLFELLESNGVKTHMVKSIDKTHMLVKKVDIINIEVVVRNIATGSLSRRLGIEDGRVLPFVLIEFYLKDDDLDDPIITDDHAILLELIEKRETLDILREKAKTVNNILKPFFLEKKLKLVDFKLEFGIDSNNEILLADEISPDSCRFWDVDTNEKLDKDRFREDIGNVKVAYAEVLNRILGNK